ncbi:MAG: kelch repeat-containing protein [Solirubrobacteraceae bacterium]
MNGPEPMKLIMLALVLAVVVCGCGGAGSASTPAPSRTATASTRRSGSASHAAGSATVRSPAAATTAPPVLGLISSGGLPAAVQDAATTSLGAAALSLGGLNSADASVSDELRTSSSGVRALNPLPLAVHDAAAAALAGRVYLFGGGEPSHSQIWAIGVAGSATLAGQLPAAASDVGAATIGSTAYVVGGYTGTTPLDTIVSWSGSGTANVVGHLPHPVRYAAVAASAGRLVIAGGTDGTTATSDVFVFDPAARRLTRIATLPQPLTHAAAVALSPSSGLVYLLGGRGSDLGTQTTRILAVDALSGQLTQAGSLPVALSDAGVALAGPDVIVVGGRRPDGTVSDRFYVLGLR